MQHQDFTNRIHHSVKLSLRTSARLVIGLAGSLILTGWFLDSTDIPPIPFACSAGVA
jgi:hypothetical protein